MQQTDRDDFDRRMIELAMRRGTVLLAQPGRTEFPVTLLGWTANRAASRRRARVQFPTGRHATVCGSMIRPVPGSAR